MGTIQYIDNDMQFGIAYDWKKIYKECKKIGIPDNVWTPFHIPSNIYWNVIMSERRLGKTTNILLMGIYMNLSYGTVIQYIRSKEDQIMPKYAADIFTIILQFDYIERMTDGKYNHIVRKGRKYYYAKRTKMVR